MKLISIGFVKAALLVICGATICNSAPTRSLATDRTRAKPTATARKTMPPSELGHIGHLDFINGFRGKKFGSDISEFPDLTLLKDNGAQKAYSSSKEPLTLDQAHLQSINYMFYNGKFMGVLMTSSGEENCEYVYRVFVTAFGNGIRPPAPDGLQEYFWTGKVANAHIIFRGSDRLELWIGNNEIQNERDKILKDKLLRAAYSSF